MSATTTASRLDLLLAQYDTSYQLFSSRLEGLTDAEYFWEPVAGCWNLRSQGQAATPQAFGTGAWVLDWERPEPQPAPLTTIAWKISHIIAWQQLRCDYTFGSKSLTFGDLVFPGSAGGALAALEASHESWRQSVGALSDGDLDVVGLSACPWAWDPTQPFGTILWWTNLELIHHAGEIGLLRDLWQFQPR